MLDFPLSAFALATWQTIYMVFISGLFGIALGLLGGIYLFLIKRGSLLPNNLGYQLLGFIVNAVRSLPFIILMISLIPFTRLILGTAIGTNAAIVPLTIAAIAFYARIAEAALQEVPQGLIEATMAMGATTGQIVKKVLLPESLPSLIKGGTLTIIGLIGSSAMAGAIGGGGLGELAVNYGYERFNVPVMLGTVVILIVIVQLVQSLGDRFALQRNIKTIVGISLVLATLCVGNIAYSTLSHPGPQLTVGIMAGQDEQFMAVAQQVAEKDFGLKIKLVTFNDYSLPDAALNQGSIDANIFQHKPFLDAQIKAHGYQLTAIAKTFIFPMGFYSRKINNIDQLPMGAIVALPNDPSNEGRALLLLAQHGLVKLKPSSGLFATVQDIVDSPLQLHFIILAAAQLPRSFHDATLVALTDDFTKVAGFQVNQALLKEGPDSPYADVIVVRTADKDNPEFKILVKVMHSGAVKRAVLAMFPHGAAIPAW